MADENQTPTPEKAAIAAVSKPSTTEILKELDRLERTTIPGGMPMAPKQMMLDATDVAAKHPDLHLRWVNIRDPQKAGARQFSGYRRLAPDEGGKSLGDELALFACTKERHDAVKEHNRRTHEARLVAHKREMEQAVEAVAREMQDRYGVKIDTSRLMVNE